METVNDIIREIRFAANMPNCVDRKEALNLADRLDAAYKRDLQSMVDHAEIDMHTAIREIERLRAALYCDGDYGRILKERDDEIKRLKAALKPVLDIVMDRATSDLSMELAIMESKRIYNDGGAE